MIFVENFVKILKKNKVDFFTGVPDSILKNLSLYLENFSVKKHIIAANEGAAVSVGIGYYLSRKKIPCVYFQNSGLGNAINPLISIAHKEVYSIPLLLIIGWRGSPNQPDEPQHKAKGKITKNLLQLLKVKHCVLKSEKDLSKLKSLIKISYREKRIVACLIEKNSLKIKKVKKKNKIDFSLLRSDFIEKLLSLIPKNSKIISTTGYTSRELMQIRKNKKKTKGKDFYMVGGMGHTLSVALTHAMFQKQSTICLDGDGSLIMHLGAIVACSKYSKNFKYILINNFSHESVGGQNTNSEIIDFKSLSKSVGFDTYMKITDSKNIDKKIDYFLTSRGKIFLEAKVDLGSLKNLGRPKNLINIKKELKI